MKHFDRILKTAGIIKASPADALSSTLAHLSSSHDAVFVFDDKNHFIGVVNPYYALIKTSNPGKTKVENCLFHPPRITPTDTLGRIARLMTESKIHYLPVFDEKQEFVGITSARRILHIMQEMDVSKLKVEEVLDGRKGKLISVYEDDTIGDAVNIFKDQKVSKLVMIDKNMKLKGILSYYDLIPYLVAPGISKSRGRGRKNNEDKEKLMNMKVKNYAKTTTLTMSVKDSIGEVISSILKKKKGSVIIIDSESHPVGILTTKDIFALLETQNKVKPLIVTTKHIADDHIRTVEDLTLYVQNYIEGQPLLKSAKLLVQEEKNGGIYNVHVTLIPLKGEGELIKREGKDLKDIVREIHEALKALSSK